MIVRARAPLRLGLAGGGSDVSPFCEDHGGIVLNATLDRYAYAEVAPLAGDRVRFKATDQQLTVEYDSLSPLPADGELNLHKAVYSEMIRRFHADRPLAIELCTFCDAPPGSGLGSSSTLVVVMVHAMADYLNLSLDDYEIAKLAYYIERVVCAFQGGRQDQYAATFGGFNFMEFYAADRAVVTPLRIKDWIICELEASLLLFYTGVSRASAKIIADQSENVRLGLPQTLKAMHELKDEALRMKECLLKGNFKGIVESMRSGWESKKQSASTVSNPNIDAIYHAALDAGALAGKVSGAGGGGYMMLFTPPQQRMAVIRSLGRFEGQVSNCHFTQSGSQTWRVYA